MENDIELPHVQHIVPADIVTKYLLLNLIRHEYGRTDIDLHPVKAVQDKDMTLSTENEVLNSLLWKSAGYEEIPTIAEMIKELREL